LGKVAGVAGGDTITVLDESHVQHAIRLEGIDAPESHQDFGTQAKKALSEKVFDKTVRVEWKENDKYGRILGHVFADDRWINKDMVEEGWAWHYRQYSDDEDLAEAETLARVMSAGLWEGSNPIAPWDFRHNPSLASTAASTALEVSAAAESSTTEAVQTVYVTYSGGKYHRDGCRYLSKSRIPISLDDAYARYAPCSVCNPPVASAYSGAASSFEAEPAETESETVYATRTGAKYHRAGCRYLRSSSIPMSLDDAKARYSPCSVCNPPY